jgi:cell division protein FtsB
MKRSLNSDIQILLSQQIGLNDEIHKLTYDTLYIEKIAREKFLMVRPGEKVFRVIESKQVQ